MSEIIGRAYEPADLPTMSFDNQRWFGDWVSYRSHGDVGYYLGCRFVRFILQQYAFDEILSFEIDQVVALYEQFAQNCA